MKTRNGFVSNSSSSSFTCDVCGETQSGMDMCLSDAGMIRCENGHTICDSESKNATLTDEDKRAFVIRRISRNKWKKPDEIAKEVEEVTKMTDSKLEEKYEYYADDGQPAETCPICMFETLDDYRALQYLLKSCNKTRESLTKEIKGMFKTYTDFVDYVNPPKKV